MQLVSNDDDRKEQSLYNESTSSNEIVAAERGERVAEEGEVSQIAESNDETTHLIAEDQPQCRICLDVGGEDLIAPCNCKGTQKYVHRSCLDNWRSTKEGFAFSHCTECRAVFKLRANVPPDRWWLRLRFQLLVARDHAFIFITVQMVVAFLGLLVYKFYGEELREMFGYEEHPYGFYTFAVVAIVLVGLLYGFFIAIICGQKINERHYHVLAKQELTKVSFLAAFLLSTYHFWYPTLLSCRSHQEYIVEDCDCKNVPSKRACWIFSVSSSLIKLLRISLKSPPSERFQPSKSNRETQKYVIKRKQKRLNSRYLNKKDGSLIQYEIERSL